MAMMTTGERLTSGLTRAWNWLRGSFAGLPTVVWAISYWPWIAAVIVGLPIALMPWIFDLSWWVYLFSLPLGLTAGVLGYLGAYMMLDD